MCKKCTPVELFCTLKATSQMGVVFMTATGHLPFLTTYRSPGIAPEPRGALAPPAHKEPRDLSSACFWLLGSTIAVDNASGQRNACHPLDWRPGTQGSSQVLSVQAGQAAARLGCGGNMSVEGGLVVLRVPNSPCTVGF